MPPQKPVLWPRELHSRAGGLLRGTQVEQHSRVRPGALSPSLFLSHKTPHLCNSTTTGMSGKQNVSALAKALPVIGMENVASPATFTSLPI